MKYFDSHIHSNYSPDSRADIEKTIEIACEKGGYGIAITDHLELGGDDWDFCRVNIPKSVEKVNSLKEIYKDKLIISTGVELSQSTYYPDRSKEMMGKLKVDFILGSCHGLKGEPDLMLTLPDRDIHSMLEGYFQVVEDIATYEDVDIMAHLTYPLRYVVGNFGIAVDMARYMERVERILEIIIKRGLALEINTSGYRQAIGVPMPSMDIARLYYNMGGRLITLGSDSHRSQDVYHSFDRASAELKEIGFTHYCYFVNRQPKLLEL